MIKEPVFLLIETATEICSVALSKGTEIIGLKEDSNTNSHAKKLLPFIDEVLKANNMTSKDLNAVVVSSGPGSYTGLRIGVSTAKGIAYTAEIPLISVGTLTGIASGAVCDPNNVIADNSVIVPMIDARRMEVYTTLFDKNLNHLDEISSKIVDEKTFEALMHDHKAIFCGNGMPKLRELLSVNPNAVFSDNPISAKNLLPIALKKWDEQLFENTAYFEPFYLKEYIAGKPVVKGLN